MIDVREPTEQRGTSRMKIKEILVIIDGWSLPGRLLS